MVMWRIKDNHFLCLKLLLVLIKVSAPVRLFCLVNDYLLLICVLITAFIFEKVKSVNFCLFPEIDHKHTNSR